MTMHKQRSHLGKAQRVFLFISLVICICATISIVEAKRCRKGNQDKGTCTPRPGRKSKDKTIKKASAPSWRKGPPSETKVIGREGGDVKLTCNIRAHPKPAFSWELNGRPLPRNRTKYRQRRGKLVIKSLDLNDMASYTCIGQNKIGSLKFTYFVSVLENIPPTDIDVVAKPQNQTAHVGDTVIFQCRSEDWPKPKIHWARTRDVLPATEVIQTSSTSSELVIHNVGKDDTGVYTCFIGRERNLQSFEARLTVIEEGESLPFEPKCSLHVRRQILEDYQSGCRTIKPVDIHYCMGSCGRSYYVPQLVIPGTGAGNQNQTCSCCVGVVDKLRLVQLQCSLGEIKTGFYLLLRDCKCQACNVKENLAASPSTSNQLTTKKPTE